MASDPQNAETFKAARDFLLAHRTDYATAYRDFRWPASNSLQLGVGLVRRRTGTRRQRQPSRADDRRRRRRVASAFAELSERSNRVANGLRALGVKRGDRVLLMLGNVLPLWEVMLAAMKLGAVIIPATTLLTPVDLADRFDRGRARHVIATAADAAKFAGFKQDLTRIAVGDAPPGWHRYDDLLQRARRVHARWRDQRRRSAAAVFHLRHDGAAETRAAFAPVVSDRQSLDDVSCSACSRATCI